MINFICIIKISIYQVAWRLLRTSLFPRSTALVFISISVGSLTTFSFLFRSDPASRSVTIGADYLIMSIFASLCSSYPIDPDRFMFSWSSWLCHFLLFFDDFFSAGCQNNLYWVKILNSIFIWSFADF